jgi:hypothetical protein
VALVSKDLSNSHTAGDEFLRMLAGEPAKALHIGRHEVRSRIVVVHRDALGRVTGSTEQFEEVQYLDATGDWLK